MQAKEKVLSRIEQSFELFKAGFLYLAGPLFLYNLVAFVFFTFIIFAFIGSSYMLDFNGTLDYLELINARNLSIILGFIILFLIYLVLYIPFFIFTIKIISDLYNGINNLDIKGNISYSFSRLFSIFKTYWYIFSYVALIPASIFIFGGLLFNLGFFLDLGDIYYQLGGFFIGLAIIIFIFFAIYRGIKTTFSLYSAIDNDDFTKENFNKSITETENKWWRILGNLLLVGLIVGFGSGLVSGLFSIFLPSNVGFGTLFEGTDYNTFMASFSFVGYILTGFVNLLIDTIGSIFILVFGFILYKRFYLESENKVSEVQNVNSDEL